MKREKEPTKNHNRRARKAFAPGERISVKIIRSFLFVRLMELLALLFLFLILYLASKLYDDIYYTVTGTLQNLLGEKLFLWGMEHKISAFLILWAVLFVLTAFVFSVSTLHNFDKTWRSLSAVFNDEQEIRHFSRRFSDVEIALKDMKHSLYRSKQIAALSEARKNDLVMYLAHDLKTPLTSVIGYLSLLQEAPDLPPAQRAKYVDITLEKACRLEMLINEFFEITRYNLQTITLEKNRIDLGMMVNQIADEFYPMLMEKQLSVSVEIAQRIVMLADAERIARVLDNLLKNAVAYSYPQTTIRIGAQPKDDLVLIRVRNHCDEIPPDKLARLFEKFFRADASRTSASGGAGLGLAISKQIVEMHGGTITAQSTPQYTDFTITLPFVAAEE